MPETKDDKGFTGAFTWDNIGMQLANGILSGGAGFAMNMLLNTLTGEKTNMNDMFQRFADQIVERLSVRMKDIIGEAFYQQNFTTLKTESASMESEYRAFVITHSLNLLNHLEEISFLIDEKARQMEIPAIGIFCIEKTIQVCIFKEKIKYNVHYKQLVKEKLIEAKLHLESLRQKAIDKIMASFSYKHHTQYDQHGEVSASVIHIYYEDNLIDTVVMVKNYEDTNQDFNARYQFLKLQKIAEFDAKVYLPAKAIIDKL
jgi:hypothetical protein